VEDCTVDLNNIKCLIPCLLALLVGAVVFTPSPAPAVAFPQGGDAAAPFLSAVVLTDSWPIQKVVSIPSGDLVFAGGDFMSGADGLVLVTPDKFVKLAATGDPVPGYDRLYLAAVGVKGSPSPDYPFGPVGDFSLNARGELAFSANIVNCNSPAQVFQCFLSSPQRDGLFLFSEQRRITIALQGDTAPGLSGATFRTFDRILLNNQSTVVFIAQVTKADGTATRGLFSFSLDRIEKIVVSGDATPFGNIFAVSAPVFQNDEGVVTFGCSFESRPSALPRYKNGVLTRLLASGDPAPGGGSLGDIFDFDTNNRGDIAFQTAYGSNGLYVRRNDGVSSKIMSDGDKTPAGGQYVLTRMCSHYVCTTGIEPRINDSGDVLFDSPIKGGLALEGLFLVSQGVIEKVVADGDPVPGTPNLAMSTYGFDINNPGMVAVSAYRNAVSGGPALFSYSKGDVFPIFAPGDVAPGTDGGSFFKDLSEFFVSDLGAVIFHSTLCCGKYKEGIFRASFPHASIPNGSFETSGDNGLPASWQTAWSNSGSGEASRFECGAGCAFEGNSVLRLHVNAGGGSTFVVSDPIPISPDSAYLITSQMRYYLNSNSDAVYVSLIQSDSAGNTVGFDEVTGNRQDNSWTWVPKGMLIRSKPDARSIRIRIGLVCSSESYLDVDAVR
jgi:hypothetical protein